MAWTYLLIAGALEIIWVIFLKETEGFTKPIPSLIVLAIMAVSFFCLSQAIKTIPIGTGYAVWTGIGAAGAAIAGILFFHEPAHFLRLICISLILVGVVGLKLFH